jgi:chromosome segregation ATPase
MSKALLQQQSAKALEKIKKEQASIPTPVLAVSLPQHVPVAQNSSVREKALEQSLTREKAVHEQLATSNAQASTEHQTRERALEDQIRATQAQLQATRYENAHELRQLQNEKDRLQQELQLKIENEQHIQRENDQLRLQISTLQREQLNQPEQKSPIPPAYPLELEPEITIEDTEVTSLGELPENTADLD